MTKKREFVRVKGDLPPSFVDGETEAYAVQEEACSRPHSILVTELRLRPLAKEKQKRKLEKILTEVFAVLSLGELWVPLILLSKLYFLFVFTMNVYQFFNKKKINFEKILTEFLVNEIMFMNVLDEL